MLRTATTTSSIPIAITINPIILERALMPDAPSIFTI